MLIEDKLKDDEFEKISPVKTRVFEIPLSPHLSHIRLYTALD